MNRPEPVDQSRPMMRNHTPLSTDLLLTFFADVSRSTSLGGESD